MIGRAARALPDLFRVAVAEMVAYRAEMVIWILTATLPLIMLALWSSVASEGPVAGMSQDDLARYFAATLVVRQMTSMWLVWEFAFQVRTGALSARLMRPLHPFWQDATMMLAALPVRLAILLPLVALVIAWRPGLLAAPDPAALALFLPALALAWALNFAAQVCFALLAFWIDKADGLWMVFFATFAFLSGYVAPHALFPDWARPVLRALPFRAMHGLPTELAAGMTDPASAALDLAIGCAWLAAFVAVGAALWRAGLRRYGAFGG
jgi:ABC-2 type transport system permease protein